MNDNLTEEVVDLVQKLTAVSVGHSNPAILFAAINILAQQVAILASTEAELVQFGGEVEEALGTAILSCWKQRATAT